ncbi:MAG: polysaccharide biosynthesis C-terminal domain-containing protein [Saprospiraceae bacterium]|nr:polysaccharide biosynthesis C-terminal domain-containing protein [Saprospiraceae bacterium]
MKIVFTVFGFTGSFKPGVIHIITANLIASVFTLLLLSPYLIKIKWQPDKSMIVKLLQYGWPIMIGGIAYTINENMDKLLIENLIGKEENGVYAACYKLSVFMTLYIMAFRLGAEPFFFRHAGNANAKNNYSTIMTWFVIFGCIFSVIITGYLDLFAGIIIKNKMYLEGLFIVPVLLIANLFSGIYNNLSIWYKLTDMTRYGMFISIVGAITTIITLFIFVPVFGIMGGAISTLITYVLMALVSWYLGHKYYHVSYDITKIAVYILFASAISALSFLVFRGDFMVNTAMILAFIALVYYLERKELRVVLLSKK